MVGKSAWRGPETLLHHSFEHFLHFIHGVIFEFRTYLQIYESLIL